MDRIEMNGYSFDRDMGIEAKREQTAIDYLTKQLDMNNPQSVMKVYKQIISQKLFHTQVGYDFLKGLQNYLITNPEIDNTGIELIEIDSAEESLRAMNMARLKRGEDIIEPAPLDADKAGKGKKGKRAGLTKSEGKYKKLSQIFATTTAVLVLTVIAMFIITLTARVPTVLNYQTVLNDRYAAWEQELSEREIELSKRENELRKQEEN